LFFDIRRANAAFASLDLDDAIGVIGTSSTSGLGARKDLLDFNAVAHNGPVTSVQWNSLGDKIITSGHDQRIRIWDAASGKNDLVHFGPRIRNERQGELRPLLSPRAFHRPGQECLWWPNDDDKGMIFQHHLREGRLLKILRTEGVQIAEVQQKAKRGKGGGSSLGRPTGGGRINGMVWRINAATGEGIEMYTAHGDGRVCVWLPSYVLEDEDDAEDERKNKSAQPDTKEPESTAVPVLDEAEQKKKRKRDMLEDMLGGLSKQAMRFA
jgi:DNA excision repair protein ERCC-8